VESPGKKLQVRSDRKAWIESDIGTISHRHALPQLHGQPIFNLHRWRLRERLSFRDAFHRADPASGCSREKETGRRQIGPLIPINLLKTEPASRPC
jgi:hypothetical protein